MWKLVLVFCLLAIFSVKGQILQEGRCDSIDVGLQSDFDIEEFAGTWYDIRSAETPWSGDCAFFEFQSFDTDAIAVTHSTVRQNFLQTAFGTGTLVPNSARLSLTIPQWSDTDIDFWVITAVYDNYALTYGCQDVGTTQRNVYIWQLSRNETFAFPLLNQMFNTIVNETFGITNNQLRDTSFSDNACFILPIIPPGESVIIPGQCDQNINGVANFDVPEFLGVWHQVAAYQSENQNGTCNRAQYSDGGGAVNVVNSQIVNQELITISGSATLVGTGGNGHLNVTLEISPGVFVDSELKILGTDYTRWAISYTCVDIGEDSRQLFSWILSRTRVLPESVQTEVNQVISTYLELNDQYYQITDQSQTGCFYVPAPVLNQPVVFGGQCDQNIAVVSDFNATLYLGIWHDIESYPNPFQDGTCATAEYSLGDGVVNVYNTQVVNQTLDEIYGTAVQVGNDAKLVVTFPIAGTNQTVDTDYWVIATDYDSYSLVYSCSNINDYQQQVTVWKLSRSKSLTNQTDIDNAMTQVPVIDQQFFEETDQTPGGCYFIPEPTGEVVRFPGQCEDVPIAEDFDFTRFNGLWYEVQSYPKNDQPGQCVIHQFASTGNNGMAISTTSIVDQLMVVRQGLLTRINATSTAAAFDFSIPGQNSVSFPFYIIDTDYDNYTLAYSCVEDGDYFKKIYAWKLSRTTQLSADSEAAIANAAVDIDVIREDFFEPTLHTYYACYFFPPNLNNGDPVILGEQCIDDVPVMQNFDAGNYLGRWHLIESYPSDNQIGTCNEAFYELNGTEIIVQNSEVRNQTLSQDIGIAVLENATVGQLSVTFPGALEPVQLYVLDTDYQTYSLVYACVNLDSNSSRVFSWKMSRSRSLIPEAVNAIAATVDTITVLNNRYYEIVDHSDDGCFYLPPPGASIVIFPGQCDQNISVVTDFNVTGYLNLWYDMASYPLPFQDGDCPNAFYSLGDDGVDVYNTQVIDQRLDTIRGVAVLANDTSNEAKLLVNFPSVGNQTSNYWVLATDYVDYALVYACENLDEERRQVSSWKLSRSKFLSDEAVTVMNNIIEAIPVLNDQYYIERDQTPEGCFYFPDPEPGKPVEFPGECDLNITVVQNFDVLRFDGVWHEIEAYPKEQQQGDCIRHVFTVQQPTNNSFGLQSFNVIAESLGITDGVVSFSSNDNSARFTITFTSNNASYEIPYWIIDTDYDNYALAYSCVNNPEADLRNVFSWKLSRTRDLSPTHAEMIRNATADIIVLDERYYENINQSEDACFYLPDLQPGEPVIFPGSCNPNITVVPNFNASRYLGEWRLIESYPSAFQVGKCSDTTYTIDNGTIIVVNTEVVNQTLSTITGQAEIIDNGILLVIFPDAPTPIEYWVLDTDYDSYSIVYSCVNINSDERQIFSWKLSRTNTLDSNATAAIDAVLDRVDVLNQRYYQVDDRSDVGCFYYPVPDGNVVVFRGQCDETIPVVAPFNIPDYSGLWYDVGSYPLPFQNGDCPNARYTLGIEGVEVYNTQVINQTLDTINGLAYPANASSDEAKLLVNFPSIGNFTSNYWVLATNYTDFAFVYSCENLGEEHRQVSSWKLSRSKLLSVGAVTVMNDIIDTIPVLDDRYYIERDQTPEGCFYFPDPEPGKPVEFPGECDMNINVVQNFDVLRFDGVWHETEAYPKEQQQGDCIRHVFTVQQPTNNSFGLQSFNVIAESLGITDGVVSFSSNDNSARFTITFTSNNASYEIPYWIIDTDYDNYALAYSCVNNPEADLRNVFSWKLSRTRDLSPTHAEMIRNATADIIVLDERYYENINQSEDACFYLPDLQPGEPVIFPGSCNPNITVVPNFNASRYLGEWRLIESYPSAFQVGKCSDTTYTIDNGTIIVVNTEVVNQTLSTITGQAEIIDNGKLLVTFPDAPTPIEYWVLDTDYDSYSIVYSCVNINSDERQIFSWKLSRTNTLDSNATAAIDAVLERVDVLNQRYYQVDDRSDVGCFYYPVPDGNVVVFRGQCDETIPVVAPFNIPDYSGLWYDVGSYPLPFQNGDCPNARYTLGIEGVEVYNTQVINQTLDTINGLAYPANASSDEAKLLVNFPSIGNFTSNYWVLATNYTDFAFVYSCENLGEEHRQVSSWKLSRSKFLSVGAVTVMNDIIDTIPVLDDRYYIERDQTPEGCFYFPEPETGKPVEFPGECNLNITVVQNFDVQRFEGVWHEIEAYPKEQQQGDCIRHDFTVQQPANNSFELQSFNVIAESLGITDGVVTFSSNDNSARFTITFTSNATTFTIPYWIIDTDYDNYALAYSCVDRDNIDYRGVFSWKLSRTKELPQTYAQRIEDAMANIDVIDQRYFETIDQSDDACFYLPDLVPGEAVVFPGRCDANITVVPNFDAGRYLGRWKLIEHYPSDFQLGTCGEAEYSLGSSGEVIVRNTEVVNQTLSIDVGVAEIIDNGKLLVRFPNAPEPIELWVLDTDYDSYSVVYSCININSEQRRVFSWKLSKTDNFNSTVNASINAVIDRVNVLDQRYYLNVDRTPDACFYFPVPDGNPVRFRAQCDESIPVVTGFDPEAYGNLWYDIASYPIQDQNGECPNAYYTLGDNGVDVFNTQVINQTLDTIRGIAILANASSDEAKLLVNFPTVGPFYSNYWVLSTNYSSYALVYSCFNINDEYMQVFSWKLSRTKELSAIDQTEINAIIDSIPVLNDQYYLERDQTDEGCFYFPEVEAGRPVEFPGRCDENATVVQNFDLNRFQGQWFELETYPKEQQTGECLSHEFTVSGNSFQLQSFSVQNEAIDVTSGVVTFTSEDNSARFVITTQANGSTIEIPYWIAATDYDNFALAYSCINFVDERGIDMRNVYSWKLSKTRQLLPSVIQAINDAMSDNDVLDNRYYEPVDHTDDGCFTLPDLAPGTPVVFDGQCDPNLAVVSNFNASRYLGTWNLIETYPSEFQVGTCADATYSPGASGTVTVYNTEVVNENLSTMTGSAVVIGNGKLSVTFPDSQPIEYWIMDTDYDSYSLVYSCVNVNPEQRRVYSWKLSRTQSLPTNAVTAIDDVLSRINVLNQRYYVEVDRTDAGCFYYPEPSDNPTVFRGTCDQNVAVVPNFDAGRYLGTWNLIENYPSAFQLGTCADATYSLANDGSVTVVNTEVRNQTLAVDTGRAVVIGNGKLEVTFPDAPAPIEYWVLDTDYDSYSVVYSCANLENNRRSVFSWKLSRTNTIENTAAVNAVLDRVQVLDQRYYVTVDRSDAGCFYYPEANGNPLVLRGQCDDDIPVVMNFDIARYEGTWYQIERYPQPYEDPNSNCVGARYTYDAEAGVVNLINWEVVDDELQQLEGTATLASNDGSAKLNVVLPIVGTDDTRNTSLYILATDYDTYSLAYSCSNLEGNRRSIGAWKLSRTRSLPAEANNAINTVITDRSELRQDYFISVEQNEECQEPSSGVFIKSSIIIVLLCLLLQNFV